MVWDLTSGVQTLTGRCVWAGYCIWVTGLVALLICSLLLLANVLAYSGILRSASWANSFPNTSYRLLYPWLVLYFILNCSILPTSIFLVYLWYEVSPSSCTISAPCKADILYIWAPVFGVAALIILILFLHNWVVIMKLSKSLRQKMNPEPFTRIGSRVVLGLLDTSHEGRSGASSTLSKGSTLVGYVYP